MEISSIGVATAFAAGVISFLSPCVLPLVPGYISYVAGRTISADGVPAHSGIKAASRTLGLSLCFVLGFSTVFVLLGASATALGGLLRTHLYEAKLFGGVIVVIRGRRDPLQRTWAGLDPGPIRRQRHGCKRNGTVGRILAGPWPALYPGRSVHARIHDTAVVNAPNWPGAQNRRWRGDGGHGYRHDYRPSLQLCNLAPPDVPGPRPNRLSRGF